MLAAGLLGAAPAAGQSSDAPSPRLTERASGTRALLQAVSPASAKVVWASGHDGAILRSLDGGATWTPTPHPTVDSLEFRDVHGFDADRAVVLSAGPGDRSRIYRTTDGGASWALSWTNPEPAGFYDCLDFWDEERGLAYGDAVEGGLRILLTLDGGASWRRVPEDRLPAALPGEGGFAASGTCVKALPGGRAWIGTGAGERPRILSTRDYGDTWAAGDLPIVTGSAAGAFTVVFEDVGHGVVLGGDLGDAEGFSDNVAITGDGGASWSPATRTPFPGAVFGAALATRPDGTVELVAVGPGGLAVTSDLRGPWSVLDGRSFWAVGALGAKAWAVGPEGRILELEW